MDNPYKVGDKVVVRPSADYPEPKRFAGLVGTVGRVHKTTVPYPVTASSWMKVSGPTNSGEPKAFTTTTFTNHTAATLKSWIKTRVAVSVGSARSRITGFALLVARLLFDTFSY